MVHHCTMFHFERTRHKQVIDTYVILPEALYCCLQSCNVYILILMVGCTVTSEVFDLPSPLYWSLSYMTLQTNQNALARPVMDYNLCAKFHFSILLVFEIRLLKLNNNNNGKSFENLLF